MTTFTPTSNQTGAPDIEWPLEWHDYTWIVVCVACVCIGVIGNLTLIYIILRNESMRNTRNLLICNIAFGDLLLIVSYPTYTLAFVFPQLDISWTDFLCKFFKTWLLISQGVSVFSLTWLSVERYQAFSTTQRSFVSRNVLFITCSIWVVSICITLPLMIRAKASADNRSCTEFPINMLSGKAYTLFQFTALYVIPLFIIVIHYCLIIGILFKSMKMMPEQTSNRVDQLRRRKRSSAVLSLITLMFAVCWLPYFIRNILIHFNHQVIHEMWLVRFNQFSDVMIYISGCINPLTLFLISKRHRHYFKKYLCCASQRSRGIAIGLLSNARSLFNTSPSVHTQSDVNMRTIDFTEQKHEYSCIKQEDTV